MNRYVLIAVFGLALGLQACDPGQEAASTTPAPAPDAVHTTTGEIAGISGIDVMISHQAIPDLGWPAMTMTFKAPDTSAVAGLAPGTAVEFSFRQQGSDNVLTEIKPR